MQVKAPIQYSLFVFEVWTARTGRKQNLHSSAQGRHQGQLTAILNKNLNRRRQTKIP